MSKQAVQAPAAVKATPAPTGTLQRQCACGQHTNGGECEACNQEHEGLVQRSAINAMPADRVPYNAYRLFGSRNQSMSAETRAFSEPGLGRDFSRIPSSAPTVRAPLPRLAISQPGDEYEQEADRIAQQV